MNLVQIEERSGSTFTDLILSRQDFFIHKQIECKDKRVYVRVWKRFFTI